MAWHLAKRALAAEHLSTVLSLAGRGLYERGIWHHKQAEAMRPVHVYDLDANPATGPERAVPVLRDPAHQKTRPGHDRSSSVRAGRGGRVFARFDPLMSVPGRPDGVDGDHRLIRVIPGLDFLELLVGGGQQHELSFGGGIDEVAVVVACVPRTERVPEGSDGHSYAS
jgi:hypothetical protein